MSRLLHPFTPPAKDTGDFLNIVSGKGSVLTLKDGREILDGMGSLWYCNVGYGHPKVTEAIKSQLDTIHAHHISIPSPTTSPRHSRPRSQIGHRCPTARSFSLNRVRRLSTRR